MFISKARMLIGGPDFIDFHLIGRATGSLRFVSAAPVR